MAARNAPKQQTQTTQEKAPTTRPKTRRPAVQQPVYEPEAIHTVGYGQGERRSNMPRLLAALGVVVAIGAGVGVYEYFKLKTEANNQEAEALLQFGFDEQSIAFDVQGNTDILAVTCPDSEPIAFYFDSQEVTAYLQQPPLTDATEEVIIEEGRRIDFPLGSIDEIAEFIDVDFLPICARNKD